MDDIYYKNSTSSANYSKYNRVALTTVTYRKGTDFASPTGQCSIPLSSDFLQQSDWQAQTTEYGQQIRFGAEVTQNAIPTAWFRRSNATLPGIDMWSFKVNSRLSIAPGVRRTLLFSSPSTALLGLNDLPL